jgi:hypothetical protein
MGEDFDGITLPAEQIRVIPEWSANRNLRGEAGSPADSISAKGDKKRRPLY